VRLVKILAIETSMGRTSIAISQGEAAGPPLVRRMEGREGQAERLIPAIAALMESAGLAYTSMDRIAVCIGPGGFSGIRTGVAAARGIGLAAGVPVVGATSFQIMAAAFEEDPHCPERYGLVAPAGLNAFYCQRLRRGSIATTPVQLLQCAGLEPFFSGQADVVAGPAARAVFEEGHVSTAAAGADLFPDASALAEIASMLDPALDLPSPFYIRPADARPQVGHAVARKSG
jgi:tRNA threonylcarbamoyl adenosine modification protein YeaZ